MFSQRDEEKYIIEYFKNTKGILLDIGAYDGKTFSNTRQLILQGWGGVLVEPSPSVIPVLEDLYKDNTSIEIVKVGVGLENGTFPFYNFYGDAIGSFDKEHAELWSEKGKRKYKEIPIKVISMSNLFAQIGFNVDFINIDTEGWSIDLLKNLPFDKLTNLKMICVEFEYQNSTVLSIAKKYKFRVLHKTAENIILVK